MKMSLTRMKNMIRAAGKGKDLYLTLIDEEGLIFSANTYMLKDFGLDDPRSIKTSFLDLIHPANINDLKKTIQLASQQQSPASVELYIKNGYYHAIKWQISSLQSQKSAQKLYFCLGYRIMDETRIKKFNALAQKHYLLILETLAGIIFHDENGELIAVNQKTASMFNTTLERLYELKDIGRLWDSEWEIYTEEGDRVAFEDTPFMKTTRTGKPHSATLIIRLANGESRWMTFNSQPLTDKAEGCTVVSSILDVTTEKLLMTKIQEKKGLVNAFLRQAPNLAWVVNEEGGLVLASAAFYSYFGISEAESVNKKLSDLVPATVYEMFYEKHLAVYKTGVPVKFMEKVRFSDGVKYISHIHIFPVEGTDGKKLVGGYAVNIPDTSRIEAELRQANERLLLLNQATTSAIWEWDMKTGDIFLNDALMEMIGYQTDDSKGLSWWLRRIHPEDRNRVSDKVKEATESYQQSWEEEYRFRCADNQYKHVREKGFVIYENALPVKMIGSLQDISALKELENKLADEKLQRQKELSETVISVQENERTRIGHELHDNVNQVLSTAMLFVKMLSPEGREQKQLKSKSLEYLQSAIEEIRKLSKELVVPQFKEQGLVDSIRSLVDDINMAHPIKIKFTYDLESDLLSAGKKITLFRIIQEQLKNILNHSKAKKAEILLLSRHDDVQLIITDNGIGFDATRSHKGIGFSNMYERVSFYSGNVAIQTAPRKGCTLTVTLPIS